MSEAATPTLQLALRRRADVELTGPLADPRFWSVSSVNG
jgi:hypothetical protein